MGNVRVGIIVFLIGALAVWKVSNGRVLGVGNTGFSTDKKWSLIVGGDVMLGRSVNTRSLKYHDFNFPFLQTSALLSSANLTMVNLENPIVDGCQPTDKGMIFCAPPESLAGLVKSGVDVVNLDNNHTSNYGEDGIAQTKKWLDQYEVGYFDDETFLQREVSGVKIGVMGFDLVTDSRPVRIEKMIEDVSRNSNLVEVMIVNLHWGAEYVDKPNPQMNTIAKRLVESGADLIVGHHSHVIGKYETIDGVPVIYSLGNLVFDQMWSEATRIGMVMKFDFDGSKIIDKDYFPIKIYDFGQPRVIDDTKEKTVIIDRFLDYSQQGSL